MGSAPSIVVLGIVNLVAAIRFSNAADACATIGDGPPGPTGGNVEQVVRFDGYDGRFMLAEMVQWPSRERSDVELVASEGVMAAATRLEESLESVRGAAIALLDTVADLDQRAGRFKLEEVSLELALSFAVEGGVIVAKGSAEAAASVTLSWKARSGP